MRNDFASSAEIPKWRIAFLGVLAVGAFAWVAYALGDRGILWAGLVGVPLLFALMLGLVRRVAPWTRKHLGLLIWVYVILQSILLIWRVLEARASQ